MMIYEKLKKAMREKRIKQQTVADTMGITKSFLSLIMSGQRRMTAADFLAICLVLDEDPAAYMACDELATVRIRAERGHGHGEA